MNTRPPRPVAGDAVDRFADIEILRYTVDGFDELPPRQKRLLYYLSMAAIEGRDILFDQNGQHNLKIRQLLENIYTRYPAHRDEREYMELEIYLKRVWFSSGIHHHHGREKLLPGFSPAFLVNAARHCHLHPGEIEQLLPVIFDPDILPKKVDKTPGKDPLLASAVNYYRDVTRAEAEAFYATRPDDRCLPSPGLNTRLVKDKNGKLREETWCAAGLHARPINRIIYWLEKAAGEADNEQQARYTRLLIDYYREGRLETFDRYSILWVEETAARVDFINGFIETYDDPIGLKGSWESIVYLANEEATRRTDIICRAAPWFENNSPIDDRFKKKHVTGISARVVTAAMLGGDCYPSPPVGINLPNANWIRERHGSKSITIENIINAIDASTRESGLAAEFYWSDVERDLLSRYGHVTDRLHTDLHECLGHGSGTLLPGVSALALKEHGDVIEEARADLFALYHVADPRMIDLGLLPDNEAYKAEYYRFTCNGLLVQLARVPTGRQIEEAHARDRALISRWTLERGATEGIMELRERDGKIFLVINDYPRLRGLFGQLLAEIQRVKSEGDFPAASNLVERYATCVDPLLHAGILARYKKLNIAPYKGFTNPVYRPTLDARGKIIDVHLDYSEGYTAQMLRLSSWTSR
ncbi:MAG: dipeptidyl peptidase 3 [Odoribacteraceae bacterium]|jgi:dipeptidyl-peptidase-3|nr:dipeptidyl peptidase 3 [Odoribacteraceae bacterium]